MDALKLIFSIVKWAIGSLLIIGALFGVAQLVAAIFSPGVRRFIRKHPVAHSIWLVAGLFVLWFIAAAFVYGQSERQHYMSSHQQMLQGAAEEFAKYGYVTSFWSNSDQFRLSSNVVSIGATQYQCYAEVNGGRFGDEGALVITTNKVFVWLSSNGPPKIIDAGYKPSRFGF